MLIAQAKAEQLTLVTRDPEIAKYDLEILTA
jgi:PIN domain nuclease of toxin-antitoxin system